ncbi:hypothetical protein PHISCL_03681 [Aspergillus sclerotialis]|uniref:Uncharacterized protein n=1 Tax=Aspergillus sclerotialis TaxID=2070753 RepID=A0A3A3A1F4_9EURO|nr:hypothetical protein PHISCL_03681 [Aspergillus sclerotialis]
MSPDRVIQDSDGEVDSLPDDRGPLSPAPEPGQPEDSTINEPTHNSINHYEPQISNPDVNFDQFIQFQDTTQTQVSSSQQRREERWIPSSGVEVGGSIGAVMSEIGHAQKRLFDDELPSTAQGVESMQSDLQYEGDDQRVGGMGDGNRNALEYGYGYDPDPNQVGVIPDTHNPGLQLEEFPGNQPNAIPPVDGVNNSLSNYDYSQPDPSFNIFDSVKQSTDSIDHLPSLAHGDKEQTSYKSPHRSKSMQPSSYSPHDTEPFSSMISPKLSRSRTENDTSYSHSAGSTGAEVSVSSVAEMPPAKKKRGRKRKHTSEDQGDGEICNKAEKQKPGRPPSKSEARTEQSDDKVSENQQQTVREAEIKNSTSDSNGLSVSANSAEMPATGDEMQVVEVTIPKDPTPCKHSQGKEVGFAEPEKPAKEPKKKKLKRGKTTSVTLKKTYESDVEDDVIWIDERPLNGNSTNDQSVHDSNHQDPLSDSKASEIEKRNSEPAATIEESQDVKPIDSAPVQTEPHPPAPKKRGRKRKRTSEQIAAEEANESNSVQEHPQPDAPSTVEITDTANPPNPLEEINPEKERPNQDDHNPPRSASPAKQPELRPESPVLSPPANPATELPPTTPQKQTKPISNPSTADKENSLKKGPGSHSPISGTSKVPYRVGLSRRARIAPLLKVVRR